MPLTRNTPLTELPGVGPARAKRLEKLGLRVLGDALEHLPQRYEDRRETHTLQDAPQDRPCCVALLAAETPRVSYVRRGLTLVKVKAVDGSGTAYLTFFNQDYIKEAIRAGESYVFYGTVERQGSLFALTNPVFEREGTARATGLIMPVYPLTAGISNNLLAGITRRAVDSCLDGLPEILPARVRKEHQLCQTQYARKNIHYPADFEALAIARRRLVFEELFVLTCGLAQLKERRSAGEGRVLSGGPEDFAALLPFAPTNAQRRAMEDIAADLRSGKAMNRLVQGDVGSGKTAVAAFGAWAAAKSGVQCAMMAPTELLAEQHARTLEALLAPAGVRVALLTGSVKGKEKKALLSALAGGEIDLVVGTHALFSQGVEYRDLGLVIADEQHRFGVAQRGALAEKGGAVSPHVLVMSATPIPRTLALMIYGDLDVSVIDELPPGRQKIDTFSVPGSYRQRIYKFLDKEIAAGRQAYVICSMVEENDQIPDDRKAAAEYAKMLQEQVFPHLAVACVHGRMKPREKDKVMSAFAAGEIHILVSTTVVEVGVDVPNATVMVIEDADRFGLSQLHQLRGRVGRGKHKSYCVLITDNRSEETLARMRVMAQTGDGFRIAEEDLRLRGPGDFFGRRQHGLPALKVADLSWDMALLKEAQQAARELLDQDPELENHPLIAQRTWELFEINDGGMN